jgi:hypothetical protein
MNLVKAESIEEEDAVKRRQLRIVQEVKSRIKG